MSKYQDPTPRFCKMCRAMLGYDALEVGRPVWLPSRLGTISVAGVGSYCSHECKNADPDYHAEFEGGNYPEEGPER